MASVLWYSNETPDVVGQGGQRRQYFQIRSLVRAGHSVHVVSLRGDQRSESVEALTQVSRIPDVRRVLRVPVWRRPRDVRSLLEDMTWDRTIVAHLESWQHLRRRRLNTRRPRLLDLHNVFSAWHAGHGRIDEAAHWARLEKEATQYFDAVSVCSLSEGLVLTRDSGASPLVVSNGVEPSEWDRPPSPRAKPVVKLFGNWDWDPNRRGLQWFLGEVAPAIVASGASVEIAGTGIAGLPEVAGVDFVGRVPDLPAFLADAWLVAVPVMHGVGAPVKYAEALATGIPVLTTRAGSGGESPDSALVSDRAEEWVERVQAVMAHPEVHRPLAVQRRSTILVERTWDRVSQPLVDWVGRA